MLNYYYGLFILFIMLSILIGISVQYIIVIDMNDIMLKNGLLGYNGFTCFIFIYLDYYPFLILFILYIICNNNNNMLLFLHFYFFFLIYFICNNIIINNNSSLFGLVICIDIISILNILLNDKISIYYLLFQSFISFLLYIFLINGQYIVVYYLIYSKLGINFLGFYLPQFYYNLLLNNMLLYIGVTNIIIMFLPFYFIIGNIHFNIILFYINIISFIIIILIWFNNGYIFNNLFIYIICISTIILANSFYLFINYITFSNIILFYIFNLTSILIFIIFIINYYIFNNHNLYNINFISCFIINI